MSDAIVITGEANIAFARALTLKAMLKLECKGMTRRGRSAYSIVKEEFHFKGNKEKVLKQLEEFIEEEMHAREEDIIQGRV